MGAAIRKGFRNISAGNGIMRGLKEKARVRRLKVLWFSAFERDKRQFRVPENGESALTERRVLGRFFRDSGPRMK
jgi:hypothetical protein